MNPARSLPCELGTAALLAHLKSQVSSPLATRTGRCQTGNEDRSSCCDRYEISPARLTALCCSGGIGVEGGDEISVCLNYIRGFQLNVPLMDSTTGSRNPK